MRQSASAPAECADAGKRYHGCLKAGRGSRAYNFNRRSLRAFPTTLTDESAIAAAAMISDSRIPKIGYRTPVAIGKPAAF